MRRLRTPSGDELWFPDHVAEYLIGQHVPGWLDVTDAYLDWKWAHRYIAQVGRGVRRPFTPSVPPGENVLPLGAYEPPPAQHPSTRV